MSLQDDWIESIIEGHGEARRVVLVRDRYDRSASILAWIATTAAALAAVGAIWAAFAATGAFREAQKQTTASNEQVQIADRVSNLETAAPLVIHCPAAAKARIDGTWTFQDESNSFSDYPIPALPIGSFTCSISNYGRVPALLIALPFTFERTKLGLCDFLEAELAGETGREIKGRLTHTGSIAIPGIAAGATYTFAISSTADDFVFVYLPDVANYMTPAEQKPTEKTLVGRKAPHFPYVENFTLQPRNREINVAADKCFTRLSNKINALRRSTVPTQPH